MTTRRTLAVGLIGYGFMGKAHSNAWRQAPHFFALPADVRMKVICGRNSAATAEAARQYGWENVASDWREVVADPEIDVVDIATPNHTHSEIALAAAAARKAILCEKPLALDAAECEQMLAAVRKSRVVHMVCHNYRRIPAISLAKRMIDRGDLGNRIYHYRARYAQDWIVDPASPSVWRLQSKSAGSGAHGDINSHIVDLARYLVGEFNDVSAIMNTFVSKRPVISGSPKKRKVTVDDAVCMMGKFRNGAIANLEATRFAHGRKNSMTIEINGSAGSIAFNLEEMNKLHLYDVRQQEDQRGFREILVTEPVHPFVKNWWPPGHIVGYEHTFVHTVADFVGAIVSGKSVQPTFEDGLKNQRVLDAARESAETGKWIKVSG
ncbi:MAG: Gfo/Idh/MocA family oxidoreductase [Chthoniobacterales bacterium]|nr:Gfo/Idh/MocA family oxidoreductase [Chthoniobacterales bacterium]